MIKLKPVYLNGKKIIQLSHLPAIQAQALLSWLPVKGLMQLKTDEAELDDCVEYTNYEYWFDTHRRNREFEYEL